LAQKKFICRIFCPAELPKVFRQPAVCLGVTTLAPPPSGADKALGLRRAQAIARLRNPNLVRMLPLPGGAGLVPIVTDARRLSDFTFPSGTFRRFDLEQIVCLLLDVLAGLSALHEVLVDGERFVHGEVCPKHIYIGEHGTAKLVPLTSSHVGSSSKLEETGYTAPELVARGKGDPRSDLFSVGVMLWEALAGERLFPEDDDEVETAVAHAGGHDPRKALKRARVAWAQPLCAIAERASADDPSARYASALELSNAIARAVGKHLSRVNAESWQDEAPTPVFQPRLHLPPPRSASPPATVVDIDPKPADELTTSVVPSVALDETETHVVRAPARARRALGIGISSAALVAVLAVAYIKARPYWPTAPAATLRDAASRAAPALWLHVAPATSASTHVAPAPSSAPVVTSPTASTSATTSATPPMSSATAPKTQSKVKPAAPPRSPRKKPTAPDKSDYGI
jgi:eukaryotic-like serine/threonine-protein kinase